MGVGKVTTPYPPKGRLRFDQHFKIEKFFDWKCLLSPAGGGSSSIQRKFQEGVDRRRIELLRYKGATQQKMIRITEAGNIK